MKPARPLVVIDPRSPEEFADAAIRHIGYALELDETDRDLIAAGIATALREFANPTPPKPEEPQGLGAVVEDAEGVKWLRHDSVAIHRRWLNTDDCDTRYRAWDEITAVRVLSEGVTP